MSRCVRSLCAVLVLLLVVDGAALAETPPLSPGTAKQMVEARGVGRGVRVHEVDGTVLRGKIASVGAESFGIKVGSNPVAEVPFAKVSQVQGPGLSKGQKIAIGVTLAVIATGVIVVAVAASRGIGDLHFPSNISAIGKAGAR